MSDKSIKVFIAGHSGMVGSSIVRALKEVNKKNKNTYSILTRTHAELDLTDQLQVNNFLASEKPDQIYISAAKVGGIHANNEYPAEFIYENLMIEANLINYAFKNGVKKILFLGSSCIYPKMSPQPIKEESLLSGRLESTNEPYAIAKIAGIKLCESYNRQFAKTSNIDFRSVMPTNLYGPKDNYHPQNSHVIPALIRRFHEAKIHNKDFVEIWGTGKARREFLFVDDLAKACLFVMNISTEKINKYIDPMCSHLNIGSGEDMTILSLANKIKDVVGYDGEIRFDNRNIDGTPRKLLDISKITQLGWKPEVSLLAGLEITYKAFLKEFNL